MMTSKNKHSGFKSLEKFTNEDLNEVLDILEKMIFDLPANEVVNKFLFKKGLKNATEEYKKVRSKDLSSLPEEKQFSFYVNEKKRNEKLETLTPIINFIKQLREILPKENNENN
jgi:hypothetical protein